MKKRNVLLLGAGAVLDWNAPMTSKLTELVRDSGFFCKDNKTTITEYIYQTLIQNKYSDTDINFETILNVIEELIVYYSYFDKDKNLPSLPKMFFNSIYEDFIMNFSIIGEKFKHGSSLQIPQKIEYRYQHGAYNNETAEQYFLQLLLGNLLMEINNKISHYAWHTEGHSKVISEENANINMQLKKWFEELDFNKNINRIYTLNYDSIFKIIALDNGINHIFEGFNCDENISYNIRLIPDVDRILNDFNCHIHYNLHGSAYWRVESLDINQFPNPTIYWQKGIHLETNYPYLQAEKGKSILFTNIITGYQKSQKSTFTPFKQMQSAFDKDCFNADNIYIIGYSFNDEHINNSLRTAISYNKNVKFIIIDPSFTKNGIDIIVVRKIFSYAGGINKERPTTLQKDVHSFYDGKFIVHTKTFKDYLSSYIK